MRRGERTNGAAVDFVAELGAIRAELASVDAEMGRVRRACLTREDAIARIDAALARAAAGWDWEAKAKALTHPSEAMDPRGTLVPVTRTVEAIGDWLCATFGDQIRARLIAHLPDDRDAFPKAARAPRLEDLARQRLEVERREELLILQAEAAGVALDRRGDLTPSVYLETTL